MTKKDKIINLFKSVQWFENASGEKCKIFTKDDFLSVGLYGDIENSQQHCDLIYARRIIQELGHRVIIGGAFHVWKTPINIEELKQRNTKLV